MILINGQEPLAFYFNGQPAEAAYFNGVCIWRSNEIGLQPVNLRIQLNGQGQIASAVSVPMAASGAVQFIGEGEPSIVPISPLTAAGGLLFSSETELYVENTAPQAVDEHIRFRGEIQAQSPETAPVAALEYISLHTDSAEANAPTSAPCEGAETLRITDEAEAAAPAACPVELDAVAVSICGDAIPAAAPVLPLEVAGLLAIRGEAVLTVVPAAILAAECAIQLDGEALPYLEDKNWIYPEQAGTHLLIRQAAAAELDGTRLKIQ